MSLTREPGGGARNCFLSPDCTEACIIVYFDGLLRKRNFLLLLKIARGGGHKGVPVFTSSCACSGYTQTSSRVLAVCRRRRRRRSSLYWWWQGQARPVQALLRNAMRFAHACALACVRKRSKRQTLQCRLATPTTTTPITTQPPPRYLALSRSLVLT